MKHRLAVRVAAENLRVKVRRIIWGQERKSQQSAPESSNPGSAMEERRKCERMVLDQSSILNFNGAACFIVDACAAGLGITFISAALWPENFDLKFALPGESEQERRVTCRTVWESNMNYYKTGSMEIVRRRGLEFVDPDSEDTDRLFRHLSAICSVNH